MTQTKSINGESEDYLSFRLGEELFAIKVERVVKIVDVPVITHVPKAPDHMCGLANMWGKVIPVIDTCIKLALDPIISTPETSIIIISLEIGGQKTQLGALVNEVMEVMEIDPKNIQEPPSIEADYDLEFINGVVKINDRFLMLLDVDNIFSIEDLGEVSTNEN